MIDKSPCRRASAPRARGAQVSSLSGLGALAAGSAILVLLLPGGASGQTPCTQTAFPTATPLCSITNAQVVRVADVNGDGKLDLVVIDSSGTVWWLRGDGAGGFTCSPSTPGLPPGSYPYWDAAVGDFNGDGKADLAVVGAGTAVAVFLGGATGFTTYVSYPLLDIDFATSVVVADFNRDGKLDLVVAGFLWDGVSITGFQIQQFRGNGDGSFTALSPVTLAFFVVGSLVVNAGDFNGDGYSDLALLDFSTGEVQILLNDRTGGFILPPLSTGPSSAVVDVVVSDFNRDGRLDLALLDHSKKEVRVLLGNGDGTFGAPQITTTPPPGQPVNIAVGDFNGDGIPDVAVTKTGADDAAILLGDGTGTFSSSGQWSIGGGTPADLAAGDLNGDGLDDLVLAFSSGVYTSVNGTGAECVKFLSATSTGTAASGQNLLQWLNPAATYPGIRVTWNVAATFAACTPPTSPTAVPATQMADFAYGTSGAEQTFAHAGLTPNTAYCYAVFVNTIASNYSGSREVKARPFDCTGAVKWAYSTGASSTAPPGNGIGAVHAAANNGVLHSMVKGAAGGTWPPTWTPKAMAGPSQGRPSTVGVTIKGQTRVVFLGSQDGHVYAVGAATGQQLWRSPSLGVGVQAAPSGMFTIFGGAHDYILVGTRNSVVNNVFYALNITNGDIVWQYDGAADFKQIGMINAQASVDYASRRVYFASYGRPPSNDTVWCLNLDTGGLVWAAGFGSDVPGSPIVRDNHVYVGALDGMVRALRTSDGGVDWTYTPGVPDGVVKAFVFPDRLGTRLFFTTTNTVWAIQDNGGTAPLVWSRNDLQSPSTPVFIPGGPHLYVGTGGPGNGKLYRLSAADGSTVDSFPLGDLDAQIGSPTLDPSTGFLYVGSDAGVVYAIQLP